MSQKSCHRGVLATDDPAWWGSKKRHRNWRRSHVLVLDPFRNGNLRLGVHFDLKVKCHNSLHYEKTLLLGGVLYCSREFLLPSAEWISEWIEMFWSKWFFRIQKTCPFLSCIWPLKSYPLSSFASLPWLLTQLRVCKQSPIQSIWHVLLPMRPGYLGGLQSLQLPWNDIMNSVRLKCQTKIQITLKRICDHCQFEAVDTFERLCSLYMSVHWWSEHVITVAELSLSMHRCRPTIATFTSWCLDQQGLHMKVPLPLGNLQRLVVLFTSHDIVFSFIQPMLLGLLFSTHSFQKNRLISLLHQIWLSNVAGLYWNAAKGWSWMQVAIIAWSCSCLRATPWSRPRRSEWKTSVYLHFASWVSCRSASWQRSIILTLRVTLVSWKMLRDMTVHEYHHLLGFPRTNWVASAWMCWRSKLWRDGHQMKQSVNHSQSIWIHHHTSTTNNNMQKWQPSSQWQ